MPYVYPWAIIRKIGPLLSNSILLYCHLHVFMLRENINTRYN